MVIADIDIDEYYTKEQLADFKNVFDGFVRDDGKNRIATSDITSVLKKMGLKLSEAQVKAIVAAEGVVDGKPCKTFVDFEVFCIILLRIMGCKRRVDQLNYKDYLPDDKIEFFGKVFRLYDFDDSKSIGAEELQAVFVRIGVSLTQDQIKSVLHEVDKDKSGEIEFSEFCAMLITLIKQKRRILYREYFTNDQILEFKNLFNATDTSGDGTLSTGELDGLFKKLKMPLTRTQLDSVASDAISHSTSNNGYNTSKGINANTLISTSAVGDVDFSQFCTMLIKLRRERRKRNISSDGGIPIETLKRDGMDTKEFRAAGYCAKDLREHSFSAKLMINAGFLPLQLREAEYSAKELKNGGLGPCALRKCGYSLTELRHAGFSDASLVRISKSLNAKYTDYDFEIANRQEIQQDTDEVIVDKKLKRPSIHNQPQPIYLPCHMTPRIRREIGKKQAQMASLLQG